MTKMAFPWMHWKSKLVPVKLIVKQIVVDVRKNILCSINCNCTSNPVICCMNAPESIDGGDEDWHVSYIQFIFYLLRLEIGLLKSYIIIIIWIYYLLLYMYNSKDNNKDD